jgi:hypothetical protein
LNYRGQYKNNKELTRCQNGKTTANQQQQQINNSKSTTTATAALFILKAMEMKQQEKT